MEIKSISNYLFRSKSDKDTSTFLRDGIYLFELNKSTFLYDPTIQLSEYVVKEEEVMRIDLIYQNMYELTEYDGFDHIDVILYINNIKNPLNIIKGTILKYPKFEDLDSFRVSNDALTLDKKDSIKRTLSFPNKKTRKDKNRKEYTDNGYSLPPVVLDSPRNPVVVKDGKISVGGL